MLLYTWDFFIIKVWVLEKNGMKYVEASALNAINIKSIFESIGLGNFFKYIYLSN